MNTQITVAFVALLLSLSNAHGFTGSGTGSGNDPYVITNAAQLQEMSDQLSAHYVLGNDIDASATASWNGGAGFEPVGDNASQFTGSLDGQGFAIENLTILRPTETAALFGSADGAVFENLIFEGGTITGLGAAVLVSYAEGSSSITNVTSSADICGYSGCGGIAGVVYNTDISNCHCSGDVIMKAAHWKVGGLVGFVSSNFGTPASEVIDCSATGHVSQGDFNTSEIGGLIGFVGKAQVSRCYATGSVKGNEDVGGLIGRIIWDNFPVIEECYATGTVFGTDEVGGFAGEAYDATFTNCFTTGSVISEKDGSGFVCYARDCTITACYSTGLIRQWSDSVFSSLRGFIEAQIDSSTINCYWDFDTSEQTSSRGTETGKTHSDMLDPLTYESSSWDFTNTWAQSNSDSYPHLRNLPPPSSITLSLEITGHGRVVMTDLAGATIADFDQNTGSVDIPWNSLKPFRLVAQGDNFESWGSDGLPMGESSGFSDRTLCVAQNSNLTAEFTIVPILPEITVTHQGNDLADGSAMINLGDLAVEQPTSINLVIKNDGTGDLANLNISKSGTHANTVTTGALTTTTLTAGASMNVEVTVTPVISAGGSRSATLHINSNDADEGSFDIDLLGNVTQWSTLQSWGASFGLSGAALTPDADDDGDGSSVIEEYALGLNPSIPDHPASPFGQLKDGRLQFDMLVRRSDPNLLYRVEFGDTLSDFALATEDAEITEANSNFNRVVIKDSASTQSHPNRFGKVEFIYTSD